MRDAETHPAKKAWTVEVPIDVRDIHWVARVSPTADLASRLQSNLPIVVAVAGCMVSVMLAATAGLAQAASARSREVAAVNDKLRAAIADVKTLSGLLPICYDCKRIRDDGGYWNRLEKYISKHSDAKFSHGLCPELRGEGV